MITKYRNEIVPKLKEEFGLKNDLSVPFVEKIVLNMGLAEALTNKDTLGKAMEQLAVISGQKPKFTKAKKSISSFKLREGDKIGAMVTLRGQKAWHFLEKLIAIVSPRIRDFRGVNDSKFDRLGNYSLGIAEQILCQLSSLWVNQANLSLTLYWEQLGCQSQVLLYPRQLTICRVLFHKDDQPWANYIKTLLI